MSKILKIFDVSSFIHAGHVNKKSFLEQYVQKDIPGHNMVWHTQRTMSGGTAFLLKEAIRNVNYSDMVFCCDRNPTIKKSMLESYKSNRSHKSSIENDKRLCEFVLNSCGATVLHSTGYEADDIIYTIVQQSYDDYEEIHIYTSDSDMYFLVDKKVSIKPSSSRAKEVTFENFSTSFKKGIYIPYNLAIPYKIVYGDQSDCIPPMDKTYKNDFLNALAHQNVQEACGRKETLEILCTVVVPQAEKSFRIIHPLDVENIPRSFESPDLQMMYNWADTMNCGEYRGTCSPTFKADELIAQIQAMGIYEEE